MEKHTVIFEDLRLFIKMIIKVKMSVTTPEMMIVFNILRQV